MTYPESNPLESYPDGDNLEDCLDYDVSVFRSMMRAGIRSHSQFEKEYPRQWKFEYHLVGEDDEVDYTLTLEADDREVKVRASGFNGFEITSKEYR